MTEMELLWRLYDAKLITVKELRFRLGIIPEEEIERLQYKGIYRDEVIYK